MFNLLETRLNAEYTPDGDEHTEGDPIIIRPNEYARGYLAGIMQPNLEGQGARIFIRHEQVPYTLPIVVPAWQVPQEAYELTGALVEVKCIQRGERKSLITGTAYPTTRLQIKAIGSGTPIEAPSHTPPEPNLLPNGEEAQDQPETSTESQA